MKYKALAILLAIAAASTAALQHALALDAANCGDAPSASLVQQMDSYLKQIDALEIKLDHEHWNDAAWLQRRLAARRERVEADLKSMQSNCVWGNSEPAHIALRQDRDAVTRLEARLLTLSPRRHQP